jgi:hypothetical protein
MCCSLNGPRLIRTIVFVCRIRAMGPPARLRPGCVGAADALPCRRVHGGAEQRDATLRHSAPSGSRCTIGDLGAVARIETRRHGIGVSTPAEPITTG